MRIKLFEEFEDNYTLYHIAPTKDRDSIQDTGISSSADKRYNNISEDKVYAWEHYKMALWYALTEARDHNTEFDIWEINYNGEVEEDTTIGLPYAVKINSIQPNKIKIIDTISSSDERINNDLDVEDIIDEIDWE